MLCVEAISRYILGVSILICSLVQFFGCDFVAWWNVCGSDNEGVDCFGFYCYCLNKSDCGLCDHDCFPGRLALVEDSVFSVDVVVL